MADNEEYEEASPEQKLSIATYFIMSSPIGEVDFVVADTKKLVDSEDILSTTALTKILKDYNIENRIRVDVDGKKTLISSYGMVNDTEFVDPTTGKIFVFNHLRREHAGFSDQKQDVPSEINEFRKAIQESVNEYIKDKYKDGKCTAVVYTSNEGEITVCISASNTKISSYWTGGWNGIFSFSVNKPGDTELVGNIKIHVHYFEDGNVQLHAAIEKKIAVTIGDADNTAKSVRKAIDKIESDYQSNLEEMYVDMHRNTFKEMRRFLPVSRQPMEWTTYAHGVGMVQ